MFSVYVPLDHQRVLSTCQVLFALCDNIIFILFFDGVYFRVSAEMNVECEIFLDDVQDFVLTHRITSFLLSKMTECSLNFYLNHEIQNFI